DGYSLAIGIYLDEGTLRQGLECATSSGGTAIGAVHALAGKNYLVQVSSGWGQEFTLTTSKTPTAPLTFEAPTPCGPLCPYWNQQTNAELDREASCAPEPASPEGSWADHTVTVPSATSEWTPSALLFHIEPELDYDAWICRATPDSNGKYFVAISANLVAQPCPTGVLFGCYENAVARVQPGETYRLRVYNWSDKPSTPGGYSFH
ncbi:MAG TPA: hypothetical protein VI541_05305, partial [Actinomycetota bacterium]|nr:hypothetical protein [Actinomycetota bacterium]